MTKQDIKNIINKYLEIYKDEKQEELKNFINKTENDIDLTDWNNFNGHLVASAFIYSQKEKKFLVVYHKDLQMYLYPGGHIEKTDKDLLSAAKRELIEETGITKFKEILINNQLLPIDISYHVTPYNKRLNLPSHAHFDFRYLFTIEEEIEIKTDANELGDYKWINMNTLEKDTPFKEIANKIKRIFKENKIEF